VKQVVDQETWQRYKDLLDYVKRLLIDTENIMNKEFTICLKLDDEANRLRIMKYLETGSIDKCMLMIDSEE